MQSNRSVHALAFLLLGLASTWASFAAAPARGADSPTRAVLPPGLELSATVTRLDDETLVVATATNVSPDSVRICAQWLSSLDYVLNAAGRAAVDSIRAEDRRRAEDAARIGATTFARCGPRLVPTHFVIAADVEPTILAPGAAFSDSVRVSTPRAFYARYPGTLVVRHRLRACGAAAEIHSTAALVSEILLP